MVNGIVGVYSCLACGCPSGGSAVEAAACVLTATRWDVVSRIEGRLRDFCRAGARVELAGGRADVLNELMMTVRGGATYVGVPAGAVLEAKCRQCGGYRA